MGAKQSKRSVDISGKEAEGAGEVVAAAGEGRVEPLADVDILKPQLNGDAPHIQTPDEKTEKEKLDNGTPENEKDATTEKEEKPSEVENDSSVVVNGDSEHKADAENGDSTPAATPEQESAKKPKKEKVKKKWSLRSISFSRKDKPKQEKKQKDEEAKTNGDAEKVPEETAEQSAEVTESKIEVADIPESKDEKTPETPVTEPITNGSSAPETPKVETPVSGEISVVNLNSVMEEPKTELQPEQLPINGLSLNDEKTDIPEAEPKAVSTENKLEVTAAVSSESTPAPEIPVKTEVCVEKLPLIESTPPPLPANPPPSSFASFAVTTMAPHLAETTLNNAIDSDMSTQSSVSLTKTVDIINTALVNQDSAPNADESLVKSEPAEPISVPNIQNSELNKNIVHINIEPQKVNNGSVPEEENVNKKELLSSNEINLDLKSISETMEKKSKTEINLMDTFNKAEESANIVIKSNIDNLVSVDNMCNKTNGVGDVDIDTDFQGNKCEEVDNNEEHKTCTQLDNLPIIANNIDLTKGDKIEFNGNLNILDSETKTLELVDNELNTPTTPDDSVTPSLSEAIECPLPPLPDEDLSQARDNQGSNEEVSESFPLPLSDMCPTESEVSAAASPEPPNEEPAPQEAFSAVDKTLDFSVPEVVADIPCSDTVMESTTDVVVAN